MNTALIFLMMWMGTAAAEAQPPRRAFTQSGVASWYGSECSKTASGERYYPSSLTAAHRSLPFGTLVEVRNTVNGRSVTVRINNRGPYCKKRIIDLSKAAAQKLDMIGAGTAKVELAVIK